MKNVIRYHIDIEIDQLTNSIRNTISGDSFTTDVFETSSTEMKALTKAKGCKFYWKSADKE